MKHYLYLFLSVVLSVVVGTVAAKELTVGVAHADLNNAYYTAMDKEAHKQAATHGVKIIVTNASNDAALQNKQINSMLDQGVDGLIVNSVNEYGAMPAIKRAKAMGVPLVAIDRPLYGDYLGYVGIDQWRAGELQGEFVANELLPGGGNIVILLGIPGEPATIGREAGMLNILQHPRYQNKFTVLASYRADYNHDLGYKKMLQAINTFGTKIDLVYALNDAMGLGALKALRKSGLTQVKVVGIDGQKQAYVEIAKGGQYKSTVINNPTEITSKAFELLIDYINTGKWNATQSLITGTVLVTDQNVSKMIVKDSGF
ncbi:MAG: substrate-binding domain-containing protein [Betaproteobacteria bacterium]